MKYRRRIFFTDKQKSDIWDRWQRGESMSSIGRLFDRESSSIYPLLARTGGIRPPDRVRSRLALTLAEREEISRGLIAKVSLRSIGRDLRRSASTISREVRRNGGTKHYRAAPSDAAAWNRTHRPKPCKLAMHGQLRQAVLDTRITVRHHVEIHVVQRPAFRDHHHVFPSRCLGDLLALISSRLIVVLDADRALRLQSSYVCQGIVQ